MFVLASVFALSVAAMFATLACEASNDESAVGVENTVVCVQIIDKCLQQKHLAQPLRLLDCSLPMLAQFYDVKQPLTLKGLGHEGAITVVHAGLPELVDAMSLAPWVALTRRLYRWAVVKGKDGELELSNPVLAQARDWDETNPKFPIFLMLERLRKEGWTLRGDFKGPHTGKSDKHYTLKGAVCRPSYYRCLLDSKTLFGQGASIVLHQHEWYYRALLTVPHKTSVEPGRTVAQYKALMKANAVELAEGDKEEPIPMNCVDMPKAWEVDDEGLDDVGADNAQEGKPRVASAAASSSAPMAAAAVGGPSSSSSAGSDTDDDEDEAAELEPGEVVAGPAFVGLQEQGFPKVLEGMLIGEEQWVPKHKGERHGAYQKFFFYQVP